MWETAVKKHEDALIQKGMILEKQHILIDLLSIKFHPSIVIDKKIKAVKSAIKLDNALKKFVTASSIEEVLKCLD